MKRLGKIINGPGADQIGKREIVRIGGGDDHIGINEIDIDVVKQFQTVHTRHPDVGNQERVRLTFKKTDGVKPVIGSVNTIAQPLYDFGHHPENIRVVVNEKNLGPVARRWHLKNSWSHLHHLHIRIS